MKLAELMTRYEDRAREAASIGSTAPVERIYRQVVADLARVDGIETAGRWMDTTEAANVLSVSPKTIRRWCVEGKRFPNARKTSDDGEWRIPAIEVYGVVKGGAKTTVPKLWRATDG